MYRLGSDALLNTCVVVCDLVQRVLTKYSLWRNWAHSVIKKSRWSCVATSLHPGQLRTSSTTQSPNWATLGTGAPFALAYGVARNPYHLANWYTFWWCISNANMFSTPCFCFPPPIQSWFPALCAGAMWNVLGWEESLPPVHNRLLNSTPWWSRQLASPSHNCPQGMALNIFSFHVIKKWC